MQCKICRQDNPAEARFCANCGAALVTAVETLPSRAVLGPAPERPATPAEPVGFWGKYKWLAMAFAIIIIAAVAVNMWQVSTKTAPPSSPSIPTQTPPLPAMSAFQKGITFADWKSFDSQWWGLYTPPGADQSLKNLAATGANWISLRVGVGQETIASTAIFRTQPNTATDSELLHVINLAHSLGMRVMLRPDLLLSNDPTHWTGLIGTAFTSETQWQDWFASYREFINYYATFAQEAGVDMLSIGIELGGTTHREDDWRRVIQEVRQRFKGPITYSSLCSAGGFPHGEEKRITWWDAVDYIGVDVYYELTDKNDPTVEELKAAWTERGYIALLESLSSRFDKPIIFTEIGYESKDGANRWPGWVQRKAPIDLQEQAEFANKSMKVYN